MTGPEVRALRKSLGLTQAATADRLGCVPQTVMRAEQRGCDGIMAFALRALKSKKAPAANPMGRYLIEAAALRETLTTILGMVEGRDTPIAKAIRKVAEEGLK
jgi:transcriptional regulator with XRE-family HTH domain